MYQFRLAYSGWRYVQIILGGESYSALADGLQSALFQAGGSPIEHRTDSLSAAFNNSVEEQKLTQSYEALCAHYNLQATRNNRCVSHENGAVECAHGSFKRSLDQALKLRGHADFATIKDYQKVLDKVAERLNKRCQSRFNEEQLALQALPCERFMDYSELSLKVTRSSTLEIKRVLYTVPSRMIGETVRVHVYHDRLAFFIGQTLTSTIPRVYLKAGQERGVNVLITGISFIACPPNPKRSGFYSSGMSCYPLMLTESYGWTATGSFRLETRANGSWGFFVSLWIMIVKNG